MKNIVVCCDGTWNRRDAEHPTNVVRIFDLAVESVDQRRYYHEGVGTKPWEKHVGGIFGVGLSRAVRESYGFVVEHYEPGDNLFLFGFSRGAYTARSLAGLIRNAGILRPEHADHIDEAYALYRAKEGPDAPSAELFRAQYARPGPVPIHFVGVWDTVGALGVPALPGFARLNRRWAFHDVQLSSRVRHAHHALALDEKRTPFVPTLWQPQPAAVDQTVEQVWLTGVHTDAGGGDAEGRLSSIALRWMVRRATAAGLLIDGGVPVAADDWNGTVRESPESFYKLLGAHVRTPGRADPGHETLASSAARRLDADAAYGTKPARTWARTASVTDVDQPLDGS